MRKNNVECCICGKGLYRRPSEISKAKMFCCREHRSEALKQHKNLYDLSGLKLGQGHLKGKKNPFVKPRVSKQYHDRKCITCGKEYKITDADNKIINRGWYCSRKCYLKHPRLSNTDIEIILENWLIENNIIYEKQKEILKSYPDFFIEPNICLYADGDYWHDRPERKIKDEAINTRLRENGYVVIRLKGSEIINGKRPTELL